MEPDNDGGRDAEITKAIVEPDNEGGRDAEITKAIVEPDNEGGRDAEIEELKRTAARAQKALENKMAKFEDKPKPRQRTSRKVTCARGSKLHHCLQQKETTTYGS